MKIVINLTEGKVLMVSRKVKESCRGFIDCSDLNYLYINYLLFLRSISGPLDWISSDEVYEVCGIISNSDQNYSDYLLFEFKIKLLDRERAW